ncbi:MAG: hypothetical protein COA78_28015 [Blastopirellula sp.]|nr:MAG: hypothetical protein COA78_28015 [Blastopirellula sp.]
MISKFTQKIAVLCCLSMLFVSFAQAQQATKRRAKPPKFDFTISLIFFDDVFSQGLVGERPAVLSESLVAIPMTGGPAMTNTGDTDNASAGGSSDWATIISPSTIQDEIKSINTRVQELVLNVRKFKGGGFSDARNEFTELALLFEVISKHPGDVRWKEYAITSRDLFARVAANCKVGTDNSFNEAKNRAIDLQEMVRGGSIDIREGEADATWDNIADRSPLMERLEIAYNERIKPWTASESEFRSKTSEILHEAEIIAAIAHAIKHEGFEYYDDDDYVGYCELMKKSALDVVAAVKANDADKARTASSMIFNSCSDCHDGYR